MGLSDIDEDDDIPVTRPAAPAAPAAASAAHAAAGGARAPVDLDDLFGGMGVSSTPPPRQSPVAPGAPAPAPAAPTWKPSADPLDALFAQPAPSSAPATAEAEPNEAAAAALHVGGGNSRPDDLFDTSRPAQRQQYSSAETLLDAFERQGKKGGGGSGRFAGKDSLENMTRNKNDNAVRARLLALMDYYDVLGVARTAPEEEIRRSYKRKALELHPDRVGREQTAEEAELFKVVTKAHEVLSDPATRRAYDAQLDAAAGYAPGSADWLSHMQPAS